jgi:hypothetical protein
VAALTSAHRAPTTVVDLGGDVPAALGVALSPGAGVTEWFAATGAGTRELAQLARPVADDLRVVPIASDGSLTGVGGCGTLDRLGPDDWERLVAACSGLDDHVVVDAGMHVPPEPVLGTLDRSWLVVRPCYLALRRAALLGASATGVVVVGEPGRALRVVDVEHAVGRPVVAALEWDPAVARAVDAGLLGRQPPATAARALRRALRVERTLR